MLALYEQNLSRLGPVNWDGLTSRTSWRSWTTAGLQGSDRAGTSSTPTYGTSWTHRTTRVTMEPLLKEFCWEKLRPHLRRRLLQVRGHLHAALVQQPQLPEEQRQLPQMLLELPEAVLVHGVALGDAVRKLDHRQTRSSLGPVLVLRNTWRWSDLHAAGTPEPVRTNGRGPL